MRNSGGMREIVPHGERKRVTNYGDSAVSVDGAKTTLFSMRGESGFFYLITVQCTEFSIPALPRGTFGDFRPMIHVKWGHGASTVETDVEVTYRQRFPVAASDIEVEGFIGSFPFPGNANPTPIPVGSRAKFRAFVSEGIDGLRPFATRWVTQLNVASGLLVAGQARLATLRAFNSQAAAGATPFLLLFDKGAAPVAGDVPFDGAPFPGTGATPTLVNIPMGETRPFVNGIAWGVSSTPFAFTAAAVPSFVVAELEQ